VAAVGIVSSQVGCTKHELLVSVELPAYVLPTCTQWAIKTDPLDYVVCTVSIIIIIIIIIITTL